MLPDEKWLPDRKYSGRAARDFHTVARALFIEVLYRAYQADLRSQYALMRAKVPIVHAGRELIMNEWRKDMRMSHEALFEKLKDRRILPLERVDYQGEMISIVHGTQLEARFAATLTYVTLTEVFTVRVEGTWLVFDSIQRRKK